MNSGKVKDPTECQEAVKELPMLYKVDFYSDGDDEGGHSVDIEQESWVIGWTGAKGSGKTLAMSLYLAKAMILNNKRVLSNYPIAFKCMDEFGGVKEYHSEDLSFEELYSLSDEISSCIVAIDELALYSESRASMSTKNKVINYSLMMCRHRHMCFFYTSQVFEWIDKRVQFSTDILFDCKDASKKYGESEDLKRGECILTNARDMSGQWTGVPFNENPAWYGNTLKGCDRIFPIYDSYFIIDPYEAGRGVIVEMEKYRVGDKRHAGSGPSFDGYKNSIKEAFSSAINQGSFRIDARDLWAYAGIENEGTKREIGKWMKDNDVDKKRSTNGYIYDISGIDPDFLDTLKL